MEGNRPSGGENSERGSSLQLTHAIGQQPQGAVQANVGIDALHGAGALTPPVGAAAGQPTLDQVHDRRVGQGGDVAELTGLLNLEKWPAGMRVIVRRERPHPGAQLSLFEEADGWRYQAFVTNTTTGQLAFLEARHRAHARVEDRIRHAKDSGMGRFPSREFDINQVWLTLVQIAADLTAWTRMLALTGGAKVLATCEPKALRYRFLHVPARLTHSARRRRLRIPQTWPWAAAIVAVFANIAAIPQPA